MKIKDEKSSMELIDKEEKLWKSLVNILKKRPEGILKHDLWNEVSRELQTAVSAKYFGVSKMHNLLEAYDDVLSEVSINGRPYIQLKTNAEGKRNEDRIQSNQISSTIKTPSATRNTVENTGIGILPTPQGTPGGLMMPSFGLGAQCLQNPGMLSTDPFLPLPRPSFPGQVSHPVQQILRDPWSASSFKQENVEVVSSEDEETEESDEDFPRLDSPQLNKSKVSNPKAKIPLNTLKENVIEVLKTSPNGIKKSEIWRHYVNMFHQQPAAKDYGVARLTNLLSQFSDVIEEFVRDSQPYIRLKSSQPAPLMNIPWGGGAIMSHSQISNIGIRSLPSNTGNVIDLTIDESKTSGGREKKHNLIDLTAEKQGMDFISLDVPNVPLSHLPVQPPTIGASTGPSPSHSYSDLQQGTADIYGTNSMVTKQVRPVNTKTFERKEITVTSVRYHGRYPTKDQVENVAKDCIETLAEADEHVSLDRIEKLLLQRFNLRSLRDLGIRYVDNISCVNEHNRLMSKVNAYIQAFVKVRSVCTLFELSECLKEFAPDKDSFTSLKLGPLQRLPVIYQLFKFPPDNIEIPEITTMDVLEHLRNYMTRFQKWTERLEMEEFMEYLVDEYDAENGYMLGIRLRSLPLCAQVLKKAQRDAGATRRSVTDGFKNEVRRDIEKVFHKFRAGIIQIDSDGNMEVRHHYLKLHPVMAINEIFQKFQLLMSIDPPLGNRLVRNT
ncbi:hypothetical protein KUTeg_019576 [Tegillarca granosa]|uniref:HTH OST-type domain-containing protein n=1 Tax=Tegillarca granosa TaxID=220873 RepID=A0ABQ9EIG7_TEGGR|nr:hypothetical protein KUTeg_019576 [Tegillarca granosa]